MIVVGNHAEEAILFLAATATDGTAGDTNASAYAATTGIATATAGVQHWNCCASIQFQRSLLQYLGNAIVVSFQFAFEFEQLAIQTTQIPVD